MAAKMQPLSGLLAASVPRNRGEAAKVVRYSAFRDNFYLSTWIALGAFLQGIASLVLPARHALLPIVFLLLQRLVRTVLMAHGSIPNSELDGVMMGKFTAQMPAKDGFPPTQPAEQGIVVILLATRSNHPLGLFAKGFRDMGDHMKAMLTELYEDKEEYGFLGQTSWISANERYSNNQTMTLCYFRSIEGLHAFAHGPIHRKAWDWWNSITKTHPYLSIMHEVYHAPKGHWENIYINNHLTGLANTPARMTLDSQPARPLFDARRGGLRTQLGRLGRSNGDENDKYSENPY
ncbi:hypothetical protein N658DRAFT_501795 [Parathielavia hyrcaniae]|uniref:Monooxygenase n=1 Tax=Parathielavia hyrcaniae TaxID=113614 RepID=A0AAN6PR63_9PEZI|nr:hypothetical protein N658DRAFT_501795 [Parathielavia hyrcaniae]